MQPTKRQDSAWFRRERKRFRKQGQAENAPCWLCGQPIDYDAPRGDPDSHNLDHYWPVDTHPELQFEPTNWRHAHASCNSRRGKKLAIKHDNTIDPFWNH